LQQFAIDKKAILACRFDLNPPSVQDLNYRARQKQKVQPVNYKLLSLPLYLVDVMHDVSLKVLNER
jgi:hypothetical protein